MRNLRREPRAQTHRERVGDAEFGHVPTPELLEVALEADLAAAKHLRRFAVELGQLDFWAGGRVGDGDLRTSTSIGRARVSSWSGSGRQRRGQAASDGDVQWLTSNCRSNSYLSSLYTNQALPSQRVPVSLQEISQKSRSFSLLISTNCARGGSSQLMRWQAAAVQRALAACVGGRHCQSRSP